MMVQPPLAVLHALFAHLFLSCCQLEGGFIVGAAVGAEVGGASVGTSVGAALGDAVGACVLPSFVGAAVGAGEHHITFRLSTAM